MMSITEMLENDKELTASLYKKAEYVGKLEKLRKEMEASDGSYFGEDWEHFCNTFIELTIEICGDEIYCSGDIYGGTYGDIYGMIEELQEVVSGRRNPFWLDN
jgi:hypothetical protein